MAEAVGTEPERPTGKLDDMMLAMDVVDTLRHRERLVAKELGQDERDEALKARLRQIYESQGLAVSDRILDQGIQALRESRFAYAPPRWSFGVFLAHLWIRRRAVGVAVTALVVVVAGTWAWQAA